MPTRFPYTVLDVFTAAPLEGNAVACVHDADGLAQEVMMRFARETRLSETCFVQTASAPAADYRNRIFTIEREIAFAGHPSLGVAVAVARAAGESSVTYVQQTGAGLQPLDVRIDGALGHASVLTEPVEFGAEADPARVMAAVGLATGDADPELPPQFATVGLETLIAPVRDSESVARSLPDFDLIDGLADGDLNLYVVSVDRRSGRARARMYSRGVLGGEDPATGSAAGPLCAYLAERAGTTRIEIDQGAEMGRPSHLVAELEGERVRVGGDVVTVIEGEVWL